MWAIWGHAARINRGYRYTRRHVIASTHGLVASADKSKRGPSRAHEDARVCLDAAVESQLDLTAASRAKR